MSFPTYEKYKDSGVAWLGEVPEGWEIVCLKYVAEVFPSNIDKKAYENDVPVRLCNYVDVYHNEEIQESIPFMEATATEAQVEKFVLKAGDTIITKDSESANDIAIAAFVPQDLPNVVCGYHLTMVRPREGMHGSFIKRLFDSHFLKSQFEIAARGLTRVGLSQYVIDNVTVTCPSASEQKSIATFLDRETAKIDALIAEQEKLIALLKEKRQAVISHAVTKGLNPDVPMKDSGIEWLGEVPEHWEVVQVKHLAEILRGKFTHRPRNDPAFYDGDHPFIQTGDITAAPRYIESYKQTLNERGASVSKEFPQGTLVMAIAANIGDVAILNFAAYFPDSIVGLVPKINIEVEFLFYLMQAMKSSMLMTATVSTQMNLNVEQIVSLIAPKPPLSEQKKITKFIDCEVSKVDQLLTQSQNAITLLKERRSALISAAVTGKIDVRHLAPANTATKEPA